MSAKVLVVAHCPTEKTERVRDAVLDGARDDDIEGVEVDLREPLQVDPDDVRGADAIVLVTTEHFGSMAGAMKWCFERIYYPCLEDTVGTPYALVVKAGSDGTGTVRQVEQITTGLKWRKVRDPVMVVGPPGDEHLAELRELGAMVAAGASIGAL